MSTLTNDIMATLRAQGITFRREFVSSAEPEGMPDNRPVESEVREAIRKTIAANLETRGHLVKLAGEIAGPLYAQVTTTTPIHEIPASVVKIAGDILAEVDNASPRQAGAREALQRIYTVARGIEQGEEPLIEAAQDIQRYVFNGLGTRRLFEWRHKRAIIGAGGMITGYED